jgi:hypothetical protein
MSRATPVNKEPDVEDARLRAAIAEFDRLNSEDPSRIDVNGEPRPRELVFAERLSRWVERVAEQPSEPLRLAARCQHLRRFERPRSGFPEGRTGYLAWRKELSRFHAEGAERVLRSVGYDDETIERVRRIVLKRALKQDPDAQAMEDALCLAFLEHELGDFAARHPDEKVVEIVAKTWLKMSSRGHELAAELPLGDREAALVRRALG